VILTRVWARSPPPPLPPYVQTALVYVASTQSPWETVQVTTLALITVASGPAGPGTLLSWVRA
jgi:hypothetical protein